MNKSVKGDLISRSNLIRELKLITLSNGTLVNTKTMIRLLEKYPTACNDGWIPCSERLPTMEECHKNDNRFIVSDGNRNYQRSFDYKERRFCEPMYRGTWNTFYDDCVTHWQPLPSLPQHYQPEGE